MKNYYFALILSLVLTTANAQSDSGDFTLAPQLGLNLSNYASSETLTNKIRVASNFGLIGEYYFNDRWSLRSGLLYDSKGTVLTVAGLDFIDKLNYLAIPVHADWHFGKKRNWFMNFGPTFGFLISANADTPDGNFSIKKDLDSSFDVGLGFGIGYKFNVSENAEFYFQYQTFNGFISVIDLDIVLVNATSALNVGVIFEL